MVKCDNLSAAHFLESSAQKHKIDRRRPHSAALDGFLLFGATGDWLGIFVPAPGLARQTPPGRELPIRDRCDPAFGALESSVLLITRPSRYKPPLLRARAIGDIPLSQGLSLLCSAMPIAEKA